MASAREAAQRRLARVPGIGPALTRRLVRAGHRTRADLRRAAVLRTLPAAARAHLRHRVRRRIPRERAAAVVAELRRRLRFGGRRRPTREAGSVRRGAAVSKDLDLIVVAPADSGALTGEVALAPAARSPLVLVETYAAGPRRRSLVVGWGRARYALDLFLATRAELPFALVHHTGGRDFNIGLRARARRRGWTLNQYGLWLARAPGRRAPGAQNVRSERQLLALLGAPWRAPADRG